MSKLVLVSPFSKPLPNGGKNPKNYPQESWIGVVDGLLGLNIRTVQLAYNDEETLPNVSDVYRYVSVGQLTPLVMKCDTWVSVDNFLQHMVAVTSKKRGVVIWGKSDPEIFGYATNINLLKSRDFLRKNQYLTWEMETFDASVFVDATTVIKSVKSVLNI